MRLQINQYLDFLIMSGEFFNRVAISLLVATPNLNQVMFLLASSHKPN